MSLTRTPLLAVVVLLALLGSASAAPPADARKGDNPARALAHKINEFRAQNGVRKLKINRSLSRSAYRYARRQIRTDRFGHSSRIHASRGFRVLAENLAFQWGWRVSARFPLRAWKNSGGHRANLLNGRFRHIGVGRARGKFGRRLATVWVVQLGRK